MRGNHAFDRMASSQVRPYATLWNFDFELFIMLPNSWIFTLIQVMWEYQLISWRFQVHIITENPCWTTVRTTLHGNTCMYREDYAARWCIVIHTLVPLEVWSCIYSLSDNDYHYFSQLETTSEATWSLKMIQNDWFGRKHEVVSSRTVDPWFERGLPAVYQLPKVLKN